MNRDTIRDIVVSKDLPYPTTDQVVAMILEVTTMLQAENGNQQAQIERWHNIANRRLQRMAELQEQNDRLRAELDRLATEKIAAILS